MRLYYQDSDNKITPVDYVYDVDAALKIVNEYVVARTGKDAPYIKMWQEDKFETIKIDFGSWSEFFILKIYED